jgi:hypothetical protein
MAYGLTNTSHANVQWMTIMNNRLISYEFLHVGISEHVYVPRVRDIKELN